MRIFDAHVRTDTRADEDLKNLAYFDTERLVTTAHAYKAFETAEQILEYFDWLCTEEVERVEHCGLRAHVALGVLPDATPRRSHPEVWTELPERLQHPSVVAVGEVGAWEDEESHWELFNRQLRIAKRLDLPVIATPPPGLKANMTYKMMLRAEQIGLAPSRVMMNYLDERLVETVLRDGLVAGVVVGSQDFDPRAAAEVISDAVEALGGADRIVLNSALRAGSSDVLGIPKTASALDEIGIEPEVIDRLAYTNAEELFFDGPVEQ
mgnify:CR=1 FL=1